MFANAIHVRPGAILAVFLLTCADAALRTRMLADGSVAAGAGQLVTNGAATVLQVGESSAVENMEFLAKTLQKFERFAESAEKSVQTRHEHESERLKEALARATDPNVRAALQETVAANKESLKETEGIYSNMAEFSKQMNSLLKSATKTGYGCSQISCGLHASCTDTMEGALCLCDEGYIGQGKDCRAPADMMPHLLVTEGRAVKAADMHVTVFDGNKIAVVYRDQNKNDAGALVVGTVQQTGLADLSPPEFFTGVDGKAFSPVVAGTDGGRLAVAWRDDDKMGTCRLRAAALGVSGIRGAEMALTWGETVDFCNKQAHKMSVMGFEKNRVMVVYADKAKTLLAEPFGNSILAEIGRLGNISLLGNYRFSDHAVARLETTKIGGDRFVLAARAAKAVDDMDPQVSTSQEAMAVYGELVGDDLVFDPNPVNLEPERGQIWARGISMIAKNTFAYAYQDAASMQIKMAVLEVDPESHRMQVVQTPSVITQGFSPYVSMISVPYTETDPHSLICYQGSDNTGLVNLCAWDTQLRKLRKCEDVTWLSEKMSTTSGASFGGGKSLMVFASESGVPYYTVFGLSKKS
eukprot:TRINITY_DN740_c0_g1_i1.p1 TRINITY_DN740_c0_g1~~TRINITY_DN740_c0_g1_i1.p1  ORF type:complete len:582 (+),score=125.25 TRINITY_DN740_c0_g1_i1:179-1924(+)